MPSLPTAAARSPCSAEPVPITQHLVMASTAATEFLEVHRDRADSVTSLDAGPVGGADPAPDRSDLDVQTVAHR